MIETRMPGLSVVLLDGDEEYERHFGFRDLDERSAPDSDTRYGIGSITKLFTAIAVLELIERGAFGLDDPIDDLLPEIAGRFPPATSVRHLLAHASGMPALGLSESKMSAHWFMDGYPVGGWPDVATFLRDSEDWWIARPGEEWHYSNEGYLALGALIESMAGRPYVEHVERTLLRPLGMTRSTFDKRVVEADANRAAPTMHDASGAFVPGSNLYGPMPAAGGLVSSPRDMTSFARSLMNAGRLPDGGRLLSATTMAHLAAAQVTLDPDDATPLDDLELYDDPRRFHALGTQLVKGIPGVDGDVVGHGGGVMGGTAYVLVAPAERLGVVILANSHGYPLARVAIAALTALAGKPIGALAFVRRERLLAESAGTYQAFRSTMRAEVRPAACGLELVLQFLPAPRTIPLVLLDHDDERGITRFLVLGQGRPGTAYLVRPNDPDAPQELRIERYAFRRTGRLAT